MAKLEAWEDREKILKLFFSLQSSLDNFEDRFAEVMEFKTSVLDKSARKNEMKKLIDEDPDWDLSKILNKYNEFKVIYDYLKED